MQTKTIANNTRLTILLGTGLLMAALAATANAAGNGADGWRKAQDRQSGMQVEQSMSTQAQVSSADQYAGQAISANHSNYSVR